MKIVALLFFKSVASILDILNTNVLISAIIEKPLSSKLILNCN